MNQSRQRQHRYGVNQLVTNPGVELTQSLRDKLFFAVPHRLQNRIQSVGAESTQDNPAGATDRGVDDGSARQGVVDHVLISLFTEWSNRSMAKGLRM